MGAREFLQFWSRYVGGVRKSKAYFISSRDNATSFFQPSAIWGIWSEEHAICNEGFFCPIALQVLRQAKVPVQRNK
jgi:hypothetical protein